MFPAANIFKKILWLIWIHHQCCFLESLGVSGLTTDTHFQGTWPRLLRSWPIQVAFYRPHHSPLLSQSHLDTSSAASALLFMSSGCPLLCLLCHRPCSGSGWQLSDCPHALACIWSSNCSANTPPPGTSPSFSPAPPPSYPPRELSPQASKTSCFIASETGMTTTCFVASETRVTSSHLGLGDVWWDFQLPLQINCHRPVAGPGE